MQPSLFASSLHNCIDITDGIDSTLPVLNRWRFLSPLCFFATNRNRAIPVQPNLFFVKRDVFNILMPILSGSNDEYGKDIASPLPLSIGPFKSAARLLQLPFEVLAISCLMRTRTLWAARSSGE
jgi:hypothetical protein